MRLRTVIGVLALAGVGPAVAGELFGPARSLADMEPGGSSRWTKSRRSVSILADRLRPGSTLRLQLFTDAIYDLTLDAPVSSADGRTALYTGTLAGTSHGAAVFAMTGEVISGAVWGPNGRRFLIRTAGGEGSVEEIDQEKFPPPQEALLPATSQWLPADEAIRDADVVDIDVMVVYTEAAATAAGGVERIENLIELAAAEANLSYAESGVLQRIRIVHKALTGYDESAGTFRALLQVTGKNDGYMDEVHQLRDQYGADVVSLWTDAADSCGLSWQMTDVNRSFEQFAFSVVNQKCAAANLSFPHELGHLMGAQHDREHALSPGAFPFSYGYRKPGPNGFRTIMSYSCADTGFDCPRLPYWSNPDLQYGEFALGEGANAARPTDNRATLNQTRRIVANWRTVAETAPSGAELRNPHRR